MRRRTAICRCVLEPDSLEKTGGSEINQATFCEKNCYEGFKSNSPNK